MEMMTLVIVLAVATLGAFFLGGTLEQRRVRASMKRGERSWHGLREDQRREAEQEEVAGRRHEYRS